MADHLTNILGDLLYTDQPDQEAADLPSPMTLRRKILIKAKRLPQDQGAEEEDDDDDDDERDDSQKKAKKQVIIHVLCVTILKPIMRNQFSEGVEETVRSCELHSRRSLPWIWRWSCQVNLIACNSVFYVYLHQVLPHVFLWRVKDQEDLGGSWQRVSVCGLQLQTDQQDLSRSQEARLIQPEGRPAMDNLCLLAIIWICIFRWSSHGRLVARSLLWTTRRTTGRTYSTAPCSPATGAVAIASNQGRSRFHFPFIISSSQILERAEDALLPKLPCLGRPW